MELFTNPAQVAGDKHTERISSISALKALMKSCKFCSWKTGPQQQVGHEKDNDGINE